MAGGGDRRHRFRLGTLLRGGSARVPRLWGGAIPDATGTLRGQYRYLDAATLDQDAGNRGKLARAQACGDAEDREAQVEAYPGLTGRRYEGALDRVFQGVRKVVEQTRIATTAEFGADNARADLEDLAVRPEAGGEANAGPNVIPVPTARPTQLVDDGIPGRRSSDVVLQGEWRSLVVGFRFDVLIRLREEAETTFVDLRVASRYGRHDLGMGAMFAEEFLRDLDAELLGIAGD